MTKHDSEEEDEYSLETQIEMREKWRKIGQEFKNKPFVNIDDSTDNFDENDDDIEQNTDDEFWIREDEDEDDQQIKIYFDELRKKCKNEQLQKPNEAIELLREMMLQGVQDIEGYFKKRGTKTSLSENEQAVANYFNGQINNTKYGIKGLLVLLVVNDLNEMIPYATKKVVWNVLSAQAVIEHKAGNTFNLTRDENTDQYDQDEDTGIDIVKWVLGFTVFLLVLLLIINKS